MCPAIAFSRRTIPSSYPKLDILCSFLHMIWDADQDGLSSCQGDTSALQSYEFVETRAWWNGRPSEQILRQTGASQDSAERSLHTLQKPSINVPVKTILVLLAFSIP